MAEIIPKNHNFFSLFFFVQFLKNIRQVVKFRQKKTLGFWRLKTYKIFLTAVFISKNGGNIP